MRGSDCSGTGSEDEWEAWERRCQQLLDLRAPDRSSCEVLMCNFSSPPDMCPEMCPEACAGTIKAGLTAKVSSESSESDTDSDADSELLGLKRLAAHLARRGVEMDPHAVRRNIDEQIASRRRPRPRRSETQEEAETQEERGRARARTPSTKRRLRSTRRRLRSQGRAKAGLTATNRWTCSG